jgi:hypothetical protein
MEAFEKASPKPDRLRISRQAKGKIANLMILLRVNSSANDYELVLVFFKCLDWIIFFDDVFQNISSDKDN